MQSAVRGGRGDAPWVAVGGWPVVVTDPSGGRTGFPTTGRRRHVWLRRLVVGTALLGLLVVTAGAITLVLTPSVDDAERRVQSAALAQRSTDRDEPVPPRFAMALVATEDSRFYSHHGVDTLGVLRATTGALQQQENGGSTLDQQLAKLLYRGSNPAALVKVEEVALGVKIDATYPKAQILEMYAQAAYFGHGFYGLHDAACGYFNVVPAQLSWTQASTLAGLVQAPSSYDPIAHPELARQRQRHVLDRLVAVGDLTQDDTATILTQPLGLNPGGPPAPGCAA